MNNQLVSVIIPTYKRHDTIERAIESVLSQTYKNIEIIVVDDNDPNSNERLLTEKVMEKYVGVENVFYIKHTENRNGSAARNTGVESSRGEYVSFLDDDDEYLPNRIKTCLATVLKLDNTFAGCSTGYYKQLPNFISKSKGERKCNCQLSIIVY